MPVNLSVNAATAGRLFKCWSREWWAALLSRIERGERVRFMIHHAARPGRHTHAEPAEHMPTLEWVESLKAYPSDGEAMQAWRPWFERRGAELPKWTHRVWVFLPSPRPPLDGHSVWPSHLQRVLPPGESRGARRPKNVPASIEKPGLTRLT